MRLGWIVPRKGRVRWALVRMALAGILLYLFRYYVIAILLLCHNFLWQRIKGTGDNNQGDIEMLLRLKEPGAKALVWIGAHNAFASASDPGILPYLQRIVADRKNKTELRLYALQGAGLFVDSKTLELVRASMADPDSRIRFTAASILSELGDERDIPLLRDRMTREELPFVRHQVERSIELLTPGPMVENSPRVKVAAIQMISEFGGVDKNRASIEARVREAAANGARIVVLPETAVQGYLPTNLKRTWQVGNRPITPRFRGAPPDNAAETVPGPSTDRFKALAKELSIYVTVPLLEKEPSTGRFFNTLCLVTPAGELGLVYRKINPWPFAESGWASKGDKGLQTLDTEYGKLGLLICYDINFEPGNISKAGVDILLYAIAWVDQDRSNWFTTRLPRIAKEHNFSIVGANWTVPEKPDWSGYGHTTIIHRSGRVLAKAASDIGEEIVYADLPVK
ncbi:MAG: hypothetical protein C0404_11010 [Verrucomicrobia bacterium]|nr:hypothetical protein [Verrucomicrobiota bacterium]